MTTYDFTYVDYSDDHRDEYQSNNHKSVSEDRKAWKRILMDLEGECEIIETWIYKDGEFVGRW